ncbi:MAG: phage portal protein [Eubacteriales bacterium]|jgi:SPP1 family phage portal protein
MAFTNEEMARTLARAVAEQTDFAQRCQVARRYYQNRNDILHTGAVPRWQTQPNPLRNSDVRISHNWHSILVNQKTSYLFSYAPTLDVGDRRLNARLTQMLGDGYGKMMKDLCVEASNCGVAWLFLWLDDERQLQMQVMDSEQIVPIYSDDLQKTLKAVLRIYTQRDEADQPVTRCELWDEETMQTGRWNGGQWVPDNQQIYYHGIGQIPFIPFWNNGEGTGDLEMYQGLIDQYDRVVSGFANDLADIQEVIFVIRNYGGEDLGTFLGELKRYKAIKVDSDGGNSGVDTMQIQIPVEARMEFLELLKKQIFISGHGVFPAQDNLPNTSGVALQYMYSLLEIKAGLLEVEFRQSLAQLARLLLRHMGCRKELTIRQTWIRNAIRNETELAQICADSSQLLSRETILRHHPWVEDPQEEMESDGQE